MTIDDLVGKPFREGGRGPDAWDCGGLFRECVRRFHGFEIPDVETPKTGAECARAIELSAANWTEIDEPEPGCGVLIRIERDNSHLAFVVNDEFFIHVLEDGDVVLTRLDDPRWSRHVVGFYRYGGARA